MSGNKTYPRKVEPFTLLSRIRAIDRRRLTPKQDQIAAQKGSEAIMEVLRHNDRLTELCGATHSSDNRLNIHESFRVAKKDGIVRTLKEFKARFPADNKILDYEPHPKESALSFAFIDIASGNFLGTFNLYNMRVAKVHGNDIVSAMGAPFIIYDEAAPGDWWTGAAEIMRWFLENSLDLVNNATLSVAQWRFPIDHPLHTWPAEDPDNIRSALEDAGATVMTHNHATCGLVLKEATLQEWHDAQPGGGRGGVRENSRGWKGAFDGE